MELVKQNFSIKDLEHLSGIKAHTIRIWEKRYNILSPNRTSTNIRTYDSSNLQKILNIAFLNEHGYKISRISKLSEEEIGKMVKRIAASSSVENRAINAFKMAMIDFDEGLFNRTYASLQEDKSFEEIFQQVFVPLLGEIGTLWQTDTIKPIHEHYIVELIREKIYLNIAALKQEVTPDTDRLFVLFLPENEIHDIGLLYLNYQLLLNKKTSIFLGSNLPLDDIKYLLEKNDNITFMSYFTVAPQDLQEFTTEFQEKISSEKHRELYLFGNRLKQFEEQKKTFPPNIKFFSCIQDFIRTL
ncbi:MerR family transcriptional regulator [Salegentibacter sp. F188]|uniref:MerR family transcriptional regulator n=1 Tax=Autumnicola patrickiae TaxID=3075591 RepID=A0ABU3E6G9_9FLAO|nr:MerR family transcriptional regulator [Salegentibacter sp. F188]MDT0691545.1 MerR family transcriptional regulator [Salegentibacter sp. F188]